MSHGTFCFMSFDGYGWYLSSTAALLYSSWIVHNLVAWLKIKPFLTKTASNLFVGTLCLTIPPILLQIVNNFLFFNNINDLYVRVRPFEVLMRDPWWIFACILFFYVIKTRYKVSIRELINGHPRFAIMLVAMLFSMIFTIVDVLSSVIPNLTAVDGINPYWKIALVFKALTDVIILDDFKTCLEKLRSKLVDSQFIMMPKPPPVPPKDSKPKERAGATTLTACATAKSSPTLVSGQGQSPKDSLGTTESRTEDTTSTNPGAQVRAQRSTSVRKTLGHIGTLLSPLPNTSQMQTQHATSLTPSPLPSEKSPHSGGSHTIHVKMDLGLSRFVSSVVGRRPPSVQMESPLDPTWPRRSTGSGLRRGLSVLSSGALSSMTRSSTNRSSTVPSRPDKTPTWSDGMLTPAPAPVPKGV
ncbi:hypothetical protein EPUS_07615 [Endocarpon pusillum Z07020]|uniref:Uncharacterized protein n=1 Tax=Endocarpon pusillum (strain Z07020 / HMAS-L-300199) TaxID=1263415 RepID=U1HJE8_ENDPU|nr:uncharacterized protein EPUS_07615 [Endocarpon pusillum Z07020]ERF70350.1 hypothetical protein EPUS_07615 [Endocarpon pusillum Z07020]